MEPTITLTRFIVSSLPVLILVGIVVFFAFKYLK